MSGEQDVWEWAANLPKHMADFVGWLNQPFYIGSVEFTPLMLFGSLFGTFLAIVLVLKIKNLII